MLAHTALREHGLEYLLIETLRPLQVRKPGSRTILPLSRASVCAIRAVPTIIVRIAARPGWASDSILSGVLPRGRQLPQHRLEQWLCRDRCRRGPVRAAAGVPAQRRPASALIRCAYPLLNGRTSRRSCLPGCAHGLRWSGSCLSRRGKNHPGVRATLLGKESAQARAIRVEIGRSDSPDRRWKHGSESSQ
jgi:hypothetical protein